MSTSELRSSEHPLSSQFLERWSPRALTGEPLPQATLLTFLEAARWAPSAYNFQPWRFLYALRDSADWDRFLGLLVPFNQSWAKNASALVIVVSRKNALPPGATEPKPNPFHSFDSGTAWGYLALQASLSGWHAHGMAGVDRERARVELNVPDDYDVEIAVAIGRLGDKSMLPEALQAREAPSTRMALSEIAWAGGFKQG